MSPSRTSLRHLGKDNKCKIINIWLWGSPLLVMVQSASVCYLARLETGECWLAASEECLRLIVTCWLSPHIVSHTSSSSSSTPPSSSAPSSSPTPFCRSQCTVTQAGRGRKLYLHFHSASQVVFSNFDINLYPNFKCMSTKPKSLFLLSIEIFA